MAYSEIVKFGLQTSRLSLLTYESPKHEENTGQHPGLYGSQTLSLGGVGGDRVEDVDQHQEQGDKKPHPAGNNVHGNEE